MSNYRIDAFNESMQGADQSEQTKLVLFQSTLEAGVRAAIGDIHHTGGPSDWQIEKVREFSSILGAKGDNLLYGSKKKGETAELMAHLCECVAIMAFMPGGISLFGLHFEETIEEGTTHAH